MEAALRRAYVVLEGDLDATQKSRIAPLIPDPAAIDGAVINCARARYIDSMVLGMLVQFRRRFVECGGNPAELILILPDEGPVRRMFETTGLVRLFPIATVHQKIEAVLGNL